MQEQQRWNVETCWLQDLLRLADAGAFARAASSRCIRPLEHWPGATLVDQGVFPAKLQGRLPASHRPPVDGEWSVDVFTPAFRDRAQSRPAAVDRLWSRLANTHTTQGADP